MGDTPTPVPALAVAVDVVGDTTDLTQPEALFERCLIVKPVPHPTLAAAFDRAAINRVGSHTWMMGTGDAFTLAPFRILGEQLRAGCATGAGGAYHSKDGIQNIRGNINRHQRFRGGVTRQHYWYQLRNNAPEFHASHLDYMSEFPTTGAASYGLVELAHKDNRLYFKWHTYFLPSDDVPDYVRRHLALRQPGRSSMIEPKPLRPDDAMRIVDWAASVGFDIVDGTGGLNELRQRITRTVTVTPAPGRPAEAIAVVGSRINPATREALGATGVEQQPWESSVVVELDASQIGRIDEIIDASAANIDTQVSDIAAILAADNFEDERLRSYQKPMVGRHIATRYGLLNAMPTGTGKTICTLAAMRERSRTTPRYRGLIALEAIVREQWRDEAATWFPEADVYLVTSSSQRHDVAELCATSPNPVVIIASYSLICQAAEVVADVTDLCAIFDDDDAGDADGYSQLALFGADLEPVRETPRNVDELTFGDVIMGVHWHDLISDEATVLANTATTTAKAMWNLRANSDVAIALTATPADKDLDDTGRIIAWCRGRRDLFHGHRLDALFDRHEPLEAARLFAEAIGPLVYRVDKPSDEIPDAKAHPVMLTPTLSEHLLADAARKELRRVYDELVACVQIAETADPDNPMYDQIREDLAAARGAWLGGTTLALMACSDPETLKQSESAGALLLASQGLIDPACEDGGTKRRWLVEELTARCANGDKVIVFTQFKRVARNLIDALSDAGLAVGGIVGGGGVARDRTIVAFQNGELDVVVCTKAAEKGLNLQRANVMVHYDLPWTPKSFQQRNGRNERIGSTHDEITTLVPLMNKTLEVRVANILASRATKSMLALDRGNRDVDLTETTIGKAFRGLIGVGASDELSDTDAGMLAIGAYLLGVD